ncbi:MAG: SDR family NAD(P)-dependent oxidoreductase [Jatrophihabitans sp.]|uniref:SDR family NAD(P)-dependent oxidoreductase n=1 Tax=Jatrophihabitans sp. TaxID=1932789 RepID=UPI003F7CE9E3
MAEAVNRVLVTPTGVSGWQKQLGTDAVEQAVRGRTIMVTGSSSGIGEAAARQLAAAGAHVLLVARSAETLQRLAKEIADEGGRAAAHPCDLTDFAALDAVVADVIAQHGGVDVLVNNAGHSIRRPVMQSLDRFHDFERQLQLNYLAAIRLTLGLLPTMRERGSGHIVNISTWAVQVRPARFAGYVASKAALEAWSDSVQGELLADGILFTTIRMPLVRTPMIAPTRLYRRVPALTSEQAGRTVVDAVVRRPRRLRPVFSPLLDLTDSMSPRSLDAVRSRVM